MLYYHDGKMRCHQQMIHVMKVLVHKALLPILHDVIIHLLTNIQQSHDRVDMTLVSLTSDYLYLLMYIVENEISMDVVKQEFKNLYSNDEDFVLNWIRKVHCSLDITPKIYAQIIKIVTYKK
ncbi:unnamed protein product [Rotaria sp. Silwood1]|nr:unnamed protein product [Rotaria sp. Silwood1]CAF4615172.1 unnamed protein product [Rotaria sp. Silwood1]